MGLLKHLVLPLLSAYHAYHCYYMTADAQAYAIETGLLINGATATTTELDLIKQLANTHGLLLLNCLTGSILEHSNYRGNIVWMELFWFAARWYGRFDDDTEGMSILQPEFYATMFLLVAVFVHAHEPGLFTKDKNLDREDDDDGYKED